MHSRVRGLVLALLLAGCNKTGANAAARGEALFKQRCALCHGNSNAGAQGPGLGGVVGRKAGTGRFGYTKALRASGLVWDRGSLDRFLAAPTKTVPGTIMLVAVPDAKERRDIVAYLATLPAGPKTVDVPTGPTSAGWTAAPPGLRTGAAALGDYKSDGPGVRRQITISDLPAPFATSSARNSPGIVDPPAGRMPVAPPGFAVNLFASNLESPRLLRVAPNGDVFVAESAAGRIRVLRPGASGATAGRREIFARDLERPFGIAFYPREDPRWIYVGENNAVVRFPYRGGDLVARGPPETVVRRLSGESGGHWTRDVVFSRDGRRMFVSVGSESNVAERMPKGVPAGLPLGAAWGDEDHRADVLAFDPDGRNEQVFATGLRNCVGLAVHEKTGDLWCSTNERDGLGDDLVPDYITRVQPGAFYGWPWYWLGDHEDPRLAGDRPDLKSKVTVPDVLLQAHSASLQMTFYDGNSFPAGYRGDGFAAFHGSWNRARRTGYKVVRVLLRDGIPTGEYEDFLLGFVADAGNVWGRAVGVAVARDGALLVSEDANGTVWRVSATPPG